MNKGNNNNRIDLLNGNIAKTLFWLSIPIMGSSFVQMAYSLFDTMWVGQIGNAAVTAVGTASSFSWMSQGVAMIPQIGGQVQCGQLIGESKLDKARKYARESIQFALIIMIIFSTLSIVLRKYLIGFFNLADPSTVKAAESYLFLVSFGFPLMTFNFVMQGLLTATGDSKTSFKYNAIGMVLNIILDPLLIFGPLIFPAWGVKGAAIATLASQLVVSIFFVRFIIKDDYLFKDFNLIESISGKDLRHLTVLGAPPALFTIAFSIISMVISRIIVAFGDAAIAIQRIGGQIESVSWMSSDGFAFSMNSFTAQNYGAGKMERVKKGFTTGLAMMTVYGLTITVVMIAGATPIFDLFINDPETIAGGADYLRIAGISQLFICYEIVVTGAFNGLGKTRFPAVVSFIFTAARIPAALYIAPMIAPIIGGLNAVWLVMSVSSICKGAVLLIAYFIHLRNNRRENNEY